MSVVSAPVDELMSFVDEIQGWLNVNNTLDAVLDTVLAGIYEMVDWKGDSAQAFGEMAKTQIKDRMSVVLSVINAFLSALNAVIDAIQEIIAILNAPLEAAEDLLDAIF
jgi:hypothetical protein